MLVNGDRPRADCVLAKNRKYHRKKCVSGGLSIISYLSIIQTSIYPDKTHWSESVWVIYSFLIANKYASVERNIISKHNMP